MKFEWLLSLYFDYKGMIKYFKIKQNAIKPVEVIAF